MKKLLLLFITLLLSFLSFSQGLKSFKLKNGLTVYVWEDSGQQEVFGMVAVKTGSVNDPEQYTGLAHYLEHVMFKGTDRIGALNWLEEKPIYEQIIAKYDERATTTDPMQKQAVDEEINRLTIEQARLTRNNEFSALVEAMGGTGLNAGTSYDYTVYFNSFPKVELSRWLDLYSVRMMNPVFRTFQTELETVYEEYNMYEDNPQDKLNRFIMKHSFEESPYARPIIGIGEHLKNPKLSELIKYYDTWYVPQNMALILVGDIKTEEVAGLISRKFSRLPEGELPQQKTVPLNPIKGRKQIADKVGDYPSVALVFNGVSTADPDYLAMSVMSELLSNRSETGLLDKLTLDGYLMGAYSTPLSFVSGGRFLINAIPTFDYSQKRYESHKYVEKLLNESIQKLANGEIDEWLLESVKGNLVREYLLNIEGEEGKAFILSEAYINGLNMDYVLNYVEKINAITLDDIRELSTRYLTNDCLAFYISEAVNDKAVNIEKPELPNTIEFASEGETLYSKWFRQLPVESVSASTTSFDDVKIVNVNEKSQLFYYPNTENDIFSMTIKYQVGARKMPKLPYAIQLMNTAGILGAYEPQEFRNALSKLNATVRYYSDDDYTYVVVEGTENNLQPVCNLITRQILMPKLESKQLDNVKGSVYQQRRIEKENLDLQQQALMSYMLYGDSSEYIIRLSVEDVFAFQVSELTGVFQKATDYAAEVHYSGRLPFNEVHQLLSANLPLKAKELAGDSPKDKPLVEVKGNKVYFFANSKANQSRILIYRPGSNFDIETEAARRSFNQYFGGSFNGLVMQEIREKNSMAYTAMGRFNIPQLKSSSTYFVGFVGTQHDKVNDAVNLYMSLINEMPLKPERIEDIRHYLKLAMVTDEPEFRNVSSEFESLKRLGFTAPESEILIPFINNLTFKDLQDYYEANLRNQPIIIGVIGNPSDIDLKAFDKFGKVERLNVSRLFKD